MVPPMGAWRALATDVLGRAPSSGIEMVTCLNAATPESDGVYEPAWVYAGEEDGRSVFFGVKDQAGRQRRVVVAGSVSR